MSAMVEKSHSPMTTVALNAFAEKGAAPSRATNAQRWMQSLVRNKLAVLGVVLVAIVILMAVTAPWLAPHDPNRQNLRQRLTPPFWSSGSTEYPLGTDALGRDILSRIMYGARVSLLVGIVAVVLSGAIGAVLGMVAGYFRTGWDTVIMRFTDVQLAIPFIVLAVAVITFTGPSLEILILVLAFNGWKTYCRVTRAEVLSLRESEYVLAARSIGADHVRILRHHLTPNIIGSVTIVATLTVAQMIMAESALSYLGLGVPVRIPSWGGMVADGRDYLVTGWWVSAMPGIAIMLTVLGISLIGEWLRDRLNPTLAEFA